MKERETECKRRKREGQRERETQNLNHTPGSKLSAQSPTWGLNSQTVRSRPEPKSGAQPTEPPRHPSYTGTLVIRAFIFLMFLFIFEGERETQHEWGEEQRERET